MCVHQPSIAVKSAATKWKYSGCKGSPLKGLLISLSFDQASRRGPCTHKGSDIPPGTSLVPNLITTPLSDVWVLLFLLEERKALNTESQRRTHHNGALLFCSPEGSFPPSLHFPNPNLGGAFILSHHPNKSLGSYSK